jgi:hypothetical protein
VVTVRTFWNLAEAALTKSLLDDYGVFCALIHENAHLYGRAPFAMPVRLQVAEDQAEQAIQILSGHPERAAEIEMTATASLPLDDAAPPLTRSNPWELLMIAFYFLLPGICMLQMEYPATASNSLIVRRGIAAVAVAHLLGWSAVIFVGFLLALYFYALRSLGTVENTDDDNAASDSGSATQ